MHNLNLLQYLSMKQFRSLFYIAFFGLFSIMANARPEDQEYDVYLLIGQSNMAGRGTMHASDTTHSIEGVYLLSDAGEVLEARNPLNRYSSIRKDISMQQIGPGTGFSEQMYKKTGRKVLLVVNARGGSKIEEWLPGTVYFNEAVRRCRQAMEYGELKGILWHQGCSNARTDRQEYMEMLSSLTEALREDLCPQKTVPFIAGEIAYWVEGAESFNKMIHSISDRIPDSSYISVRGCGPLKPESLKTDRPDPHFSREAQLKIGKRYARKMLQMSR